jgi:hypothetical protein
VDGRADRLVHERLADARSAHSGHREPYSGSYGDLSADRRPNGLVRVAECRRSRRIDQARQLYRRALNQVLGGASINSPSEMQGRFSYLAIVVGLVW